MEEKEGEEEEGEEEEEEEEEEFSVSCFFSLLEDSEVAPWVKYDLISSSVIN